MQTESGGFLLQVFDLLLAIFGFVFFHAQGLVLDFVLEHAIVHADNQVGGSDRRLGWANAGFHAPVEDAKDALRAV